MKNRFTGFIILIICVSACSQKKGKTDLQALSTRFSGYVNAIAEKNTGDIRHYAYPRLFNLLSADESDQVLARSYSLLRLNTRWTIDSIRVDTLYPIEHIENGDYAIALYSMSMKIKTDPVKPIDSMSVSGMTYPAPQATLMATLMRAYNVAVSDHKEENGILWMHVRVISIAAKDEFSKQWSFYTITDDHETVNKLFSKKILETLLSKKLLEELSYKE